MQIENQLKTVGTVVVTDQRVYHVLTNFFTSETISIPLQSIDNVRVGWERNKVAFYIGLLLTLGGFAGESKDRGGFIFFGLCLLVYGLQKKVGLFVESHRGRNIRGHVANEKEGREIEKAIMSAIKQQDRIG